MTVQMRYDLARTSRKGKSGATPLKKGQAKKNDIWRERRTSKRTRIKERTNKWKINSSVQTMLRGN